MIGQPGVSYPSRRAAPRERPYRLQHPAELASVCHTDDKAVLGLYFRYRPDAPETAPLLDKPVEHAINYYRDFVRPTQVRRARRIGSVGRWRL